MWYISTTILTVIVISETQYTNSTGTDTTDASTVQTVSAQYSNVIINNETTERLETNFMQTEDKPQPVHIYAILEPPKWNLLYKLCISCTFCSRWTVLYIL